MADAQNRPGNGAARSAFVLTVLTALLAVVPILGFSAWLIVVPVGFILFILAVVMLAQGHTGDGLATLGTAVVFLPLWVLFAPMIGTHLFGEWQGSSRTKEAAARPEMKLASLAEPKAPSVTQPVAVPSQRLFKTEAEARAEAVRLYPALTVKGSPFNDAFLDAVGRMKRDRPHLLKNPAWPVMMAEEAATTGAPAR